MPTKYVTRGTIQVEFSSDKTGVIISPSQEYFVKRDKCEYIVFLPKKIPEDQLKKDTDKRRVEVRVYKKDRIFKTEKSLNKALIDAASQHVLVEITIESPDKGKKRAKITAVRIPVNAI
jgi:hypothetical protein